MVALEDSGDGKESEGKAHDGRGGLKEDANYKDHEDYDGVRLWP